MMLTAQERARALDIGDGDGVDRVKLRPLTPYRRQILYLCIAGYSYAQIGEQIGKTPRAVRAQVYEINHSVLPGLGNKDGQSRMARLAYTIGLLDAGVDPSDVATYIRRLEQRALPYHVAEHVRNVPRNGGTDGED